MIGCRDNNVLLLLVFLLLMAPGTDARTIHVPDDFRVFQDAVDSAEDGDSIMVAPGEYQRISLRGLLGITLVGAGFEEHGRSVIYGLPQTQEEVAVHVADCYGIELTGFELTGGYTAVWLDRSMNCWVHRNYIHDLPDWWASSVSVNGSQNVFIERNIMLRSRHYGVYISFGCTDVTVRNNVIGYMVNNDGIHLDQVNGANVYNNIIFRNGDIGIFASENVRNIRVVYNDLYLNETANYQGFQLDGTNIQINPLMVDPREGNFHLSKESPCIDAGDPESDPDPDGSRADMGVFHLLR